ncbi:RagB/SusD family nutrient uptake outer membrane protein [uncultured Chitinophaga sp.]|jgi:SusD family.|uniref:RagB/SusD family nutrient uptake outer membrane protein n=1 Tax=uncultured Chitinophaga sp. TaxID=339340 RepID=UPI002617740F|nr:RagB/SusD family nutrient uptake outer membrane protein [uncultured Chitinophaga sp.]
MKKRTTSIHTSLLYLSVVSVLLITGFTGCKSFVQVDPPISGITSATAYATDKSASAVVTGIYAEIMSANTALTQGTSGIPYLMGLYADELQNHAASNVTREQYYQNNLQNTAVVTPFWNSLYGALYNCNAAVEGISKSGTLSQPAKDRLLGEAKFMRAFLLFYATNLFGDIPMPLTTDYVINNTITRSPQAKVYEQIIADLQEAQTLLDNDYKTGDGNLTEDKAHPNKQAATALLARVYLYVQNWQQAEALAGSLIADGRYELETDLLKVFLANNKEAIWQLAFTASTNFANLDIDYYTLTPASGPDAFRTATMSASLVNAFEPGDQRLSVWVGRNDVTATPTTPGGSFWYSRKYRDKTPGTEYLAVLRLSEQLLIRAEARAQQGNLTGAQTDLDAVRTRAGLPAVTATTKEALLAAILHERQVEFFLEWGHRWFDLKRSGKANEVMSVVTPQKGGVWNTNWLLLPVPQAELLINRNLTQNPGYPS